MHQFTKHNIIKPSYSRLNSVAMCSQGPSTIKDSLVYSVTLRYTGNALPSAVSNSAVASWRKLPGTFGSHHFTGCVGLNCHYSLENIFG